MKNFYAALEIGTTRTVLAIGENGADGRMKFLCHAEIPSVGVRKSQILNIGQVTQSIKSVLHEIEKKQDAIGVNVTIGNVFLLVSGQHIKVDPAIGTVQIKGGKVSDEEINDVAQSSRQQMVLAKGRELLDIVDQDYMIDTLGGIASPKGMAGNVLRLNTLQIHADANRIQDARTAAEDARLEIREPLFATSCAAEAVLEDHEKKNGVLVLDLGGGSTGYAVYSDGYLKTSGVIGIGGDHISNDIAHAFQTTHAQAEQLKIAEGSAVVATRSDETPRVKITGSSALMENRTISRMALNTVINARLKELCAVIRETLEDQDMLHRLHSGIVITGGGACMRDIDALIRQELSASVRTGNPIHVDGIESMESPCKLASIAGALLYAHNNYDDSSALGKLFGRFFK